MTQMTKRLQRVLGPIARNRRTGPPGKLDDSLGNSGMYQQNPGGATYFCSFFSLGAMTNTQ